MVLPNPVAIGNKPEPFLGSSTLAYLGNPARSGVKSFDFHWRLFGSWKLLASSVAADISTCASSTNGMHSSPRRGRLPAAMLTLVSSQVYLLHKHLMYLAVGVSLSPVPCARIGCSRFPHLTPCCLCADLFTLLRPQTNLLQMF